MVARVSPDMLNLSVVGKMVDRPTSPIGTTIEYQSFAYTDPAVSLESLSHVMGDRSTDLQAGSFPN